MSVVSSLVTSYKGAYGVRYSIEPTEDDAYCLYCVTSELKVKKEVVKKQPYFKGSASACLDYLKTIEQNIKVC